MEVSLEIGLQLPIGHDKRKHHFFELAILPLDSSTGMTNKLYIVMCFYPVGNEHCIEDIHEF